MTVVGTVVDDDDVVVQPQDNSEEPALFGVVVVGGAGDVGSSLSLSCVYRQQRGVSSSL
jgi:hypothetical protein